MIYLSNEISQSESVLLLLSEAYSNWSDPFSQIYLM